MRETTSPSSDFEIYRLSYVTGVVQRLTNNAVDDTNVSLSANGNIVTWQTSISGISSIIFRTYSSANTFTQQKLAYPTPAREPSISANGRFITYVHDRANGLDQLWKYDLFNDVYTAIYSTPDTQAVITHPSITDDGNRIMFLLKYPTNQDIQYIDLATNQRRSAVYSTRTLEHPFITADGKYLTYGYSGQLPSNPPTSMTVYAREVATGQLAVVRYAPSTVRQLGMSWQQSNVPVISGSPFLLEDIFAPTDLSSQATNIVFGLVLDLDGDTAVVGAPFDIYDANNNGTVDCTSSDFDGIGTECLLGSVYILKRNLQSQWDLVKKLKVPGNSVSSPRFGERVAISENTIAISYYSNKAVVYERNRGGTNNWGLSKILTSSDNATLALDKSTLVVNNTIYERNNGGNNNWGQVKTLPESIYKIAIHDNTLIASDPSKTIDLNKDGVLDCDNGFGSECYVGTVFVYNRDQGGVNNWGLSQTLVASDASSSEDFQGRDNFGVALDIRGTTIVVKSAREENNPTVSLPNYVYIFEYNANTNIWQETHKLLPPTYSFFTNLSDSISIGNNGNTIAILAKAAISETAIFVYERNSNTGAWSQTGKVINDNNFCSAESIKIEGDILAAGNLNCLNDDGITTGAAYFYKR